MENTPLLDKVIAYTKDIVTTQLSPELVYHGPEYNESLVAKVQLIGKHEQLSAEELEIVEIATWFYNTGFRDTYTEHEEKSAAIASDFLLQEKVNDEKIAEIKACILAAATSPKPETSTQKVFVDAIQSMIQDGNYKSRINLLSQELAAFQKTERSEVEGLQDYLEKILKYEFHTTYGKEYLAPARDKLKVKLEKRIKKLERLVDESLSSDLGVTATQLKAMKKKLQKAQGRPERGIETMFRLTSKNHLDLSGMADSKANIMISINSIIMSVVLGSLMQKLDSNEHLIYPTIMLLTVNLGSLIFAILSLRPNVSNGLFTREDIENQKTNLLFFGNFHQMKRKDYHWGMNKLMENANFLYSNLIDDIYFLGVVLARKYKLLRTSYNIFMFGMVVVVIAYVVSLNFVEEPIKDSIINTLQE